MPAICIDCRYVGARPSGIAEVVQGLVDHAPGLAPDLDFVLLKNPARREPLSRAANVEERVVGAAANGPRTMWLLPESAPLGGVDLFHGTYNTMPARLKIPAVTTVHDIMWLTHPQWCDASHASALKRRFYGHGIRRALARSAHVAAVSSATREAILAHDPALAGKVSVTLSGVSSRFRPVQREPGELARLGLPEHARFVLVVGQFAPYKNHMGALEAFAAAFGRESDMRLVFIQRRGPASSVLAGAADELGVGERVHFTGPVEEGALLQLYCSASVLLHPSLCEGFGMPVAEAMACGLPVVTSALSAMPEVAGGAARLVDPRDVAQMAGALREVVSDPELAARMRKAGLARAAELDWEHFARANVAIYRSVLASA